MNFCPVLTFSMISLQWGKAFIVVDAFDVGGFDRFDQGIVFDVIRVFDPEIIPAVFCGDRDRVADLDIGRVHADGETESDFPFIFFLFSAAGSGSAHEKQFAGGPLPESIAVDFSDQGSDFPFERI